jgi:hypothetical protein
MAIRRIFGTACLVILGLAPLYSAVKQVRVTAERANVFIEPSRTSSRIEIVTKGTVLTLLQERKVKDIWYYVSFVSPRYGSRISGFILETMVELVEEAPAAAPKKEAEAPSPKVEPAKEMPPPPKTAESLILTPLPRSRAISLPPKAVLLQEAAWKVEEKQVVAQKPEVKEETKAKPAEAERAAAAKKSETPPAEIKVPPPEKKPEPEAEKTKEALPEKEPEPKPAKPQPVRVPRISPPRKGPGLITLGLGYGSSFGGAGASIQLNTRAGFSLHAGVGLYPTSLIYSETDWVKNKMMWSVGLKYYLPFSTSSFFPFVDLQYGGLRVEAAQVVIGIWDYQYVLSQEQASLWGPSFLGGVELRKGRFGITGALGAAYATTAWKYLQNKVSFVFDAGLVLHF